MGSEDRPKLTIAEQIARLDSRGVTFSEISKNDAKEALGKVNNYFKLTAYRKSFPIGGDGKYIDLDFAYLKYLSKVDMQLRYCLLEMSLDVEHFAKARFMNYITNEPNETGYGLEQEHILWKQAEFGDKAAMVLREKYKGAKDKADISEYCGSLYHKHKQDMPIWALIEVIPFGTFVDLYLFVSKKLGYKRMTDDAYNMMAINRLRNACAHNNCIVNDLSEQISPKINNAMNKALNGFLTSQQRDYLLNNPKMNQIVTLLFFHHNLISTGLHDYQASRLRQLLELIEDKAHYVRNASYLPKFFECLKIMIDNWF